VQFGILLPHFGEHATPKRLLGAASRAEELGFSSLWARDHLVWHPHTFEGRDPTFIDPFVALAAVGSVTERVRLGTAVVIPTRWPLKLAQDFASLSWLTGGRVVAGIGLGFDPKEFGANGLDPKDREQIFVETVEICRLVWQESHASYKGQIFSFDDMTLAPKPVSPIPFEYGGSTPAALRRAMRYCDGWQPARLPLKTLDKRLALRTKLEAETGRRIRVAVQPLVTVARRYEDAAARVPIGEMGASSESAKWWDLPPSGRFETIADLEGLNVCGTPDDVYRELHKLEERNIDEVIIDLRLQFDDFESALDLIGREVLPRFVGADAR
jgi:probable F420-dependent oxidoreductase